MKKLVAKTAFITLGVSLILILSLFGILSLCVPYEMAKFSNALGLYALSGDYAYQEYERSGKIDYLARSFEIAYSHGTARKAETRFELLIEHEEFDEYCVLRDAQLSATVEGARYINYVYGRGACVKYRLAKTETEKCAVCDFAIEHTEQAFEPINPVIQLTIEAVRENDGVFCKLLLKSLEDCGRPFNDDKNDYTNIKKILEECINE